MVKGVIDVYRNIKNEFLPTPKNPHYIFSLHDVAHFMEGIMVMSPKSKPRPRKDLESSLSSSVNGRKYNYLSNFDSITACVRCILI